MERDAVPTKVETSSWKECDVPVIASRWTNELQAMVTVFQEQPSSSATDPQLKSIPYRATLI